MDTSMEALFRAMLNNGWFTKSDGDVESIQGYFGYVVNEADELPEIYDEFSDVIDAYGRPADEDVIGAFTAYINSNGDIFINRHEDEHTARYMYETTLNEYAREDEENDYLL